MAVWPVTLPQLGQIGMQVSTDDPVLRSPMDAGPPSRRRRFTAVTKSMSCTMLLNGTQVGTLETFFNDTLRHGSLSFDWVDPRDGSAVRIAFKSPPEYTGRAGNADPAARWWSASLSLEIQP